MSNRYSIIYSKSIKCSSYTQCSRLPVTAGAIFGKHGLTVGKRGVSFGSSVVFSTDEKILANDLFGSSYF
jgi:hypothetical protein